MIHTYAKLIPLTLQAFAELNDKLERDIEEQENEAEY
jgi:hypothetical protein